MPGFQYDPKKFKQAFEQVSEERRKAKEARERKHTREDLQPGAKIIAPKQSNNISAQHRTMVVERCDGEIVYYRHFGSPVVRHESVERFLDVVNQYLHPFSSSLDPKEDVK